MEALRQIPPVNDVLRSPELVPYQSILETPFGNRVLDEVFGDFRRELSSNGATVSRRELTERIASEVAARIQSALKPSLRRVVNATGVVLHTNLGRAPLPVSAIEHLRDVAAGYSNLEFNLSDGTRGKRDVHIERLICRLLECEAAIVVNNNAAAVMLVLNTLAEGGEVVASRGEQLEIGGSFRIPEIINKSGARLREVGTTNRTRIRDYEKAINDQTRLLLRVHPSNFRITGFTERPSLQDIVRLGSDRNVPTFEDLGSGCLLDLRPQGIRDEPVVAESIRAGVDIVSFSGDKLLGGPQAGVIAGKRVYVARIRENPLFRALRVDKLTIGVLESVLMNYVAGRVDDLPGLQMLRASSDELKTRAESLASRLGKSARAIRLSSVAGGGSAPESLLPSWGVELEFKDLSSAELERRLRSADPPIIVRIENSRVVLDVRTILADEEPHVVASIQASANP